MTVLLFAGESYYAKGGMNDFQGAFPDVSDARLAVDINAGHGCAYYSWDWYHIIDMETLEVLDRSDNQAHGVGYDDHVPDEEY